MSGWKVPQFVAMTVLMISASVVPLTAQGTSGTWRPRVRYKLIDLGTLGGPNSAEFASPLINNSGAITGAADTAEADPNAPNCYNPDCFVTHTYRWRHGALTDLGVLPGGFGSEGNYINDRGQIAGQSLNGQIDPLLGTPEGIAVLWRRDGKIVELGTLGGNESLAAALNNRGQVVGGAANSILDSFPGPLGFWGTQTRASLWERGVMRDLGDLGGPDAFAQFVNEHGQIAGVSYTSSNPDPRETFCGQDIPPQHPFLWDKGKMIDLGTLGGICGFFVGLNGLNNSGQVAGGSSLAGDLIVHPFLWDRKAIPHMRDLGTLGGSFGYATELNDKDEVAGGATTTDDEEFHAFFWRKGVITDLGTVGDDTCSVAHSMNARGQVVGTSGDCAGTFELHGFLWQKDGPMLDLNEFVPLGSDLVITDGETINDRGDIAGSGLLPNGDFHAVVLIACGEDQPDDGCREVDEERNVTTRDMRSFQQRLTTTRHRLSVNDVKKFIGSRERSAARRRAQ